MSRSRGAVDWKPDMSGRVSLLVFGDLASASVTDKTRQYSKKLKLAESLRSKGHPLFVIDGAGFSDLCAGYPARNRQLKPQGALDCLVLPEPGDGILGGPVEMRRLTPHQQAALRLDLAALDKGTAAHEATVFRFTSTLASRGISVEGPGRLAPLFDVGWRTDSSVFIGEVKSLGGADESQQIRLGMGQAIDYAQQVRSTSDTTVRVVPVLILEREPRDRDRWLAATTSAGVQLTWGPGFVLS